MSENGEIYTAGKTFTLPLAVTGGTNLTSVFKQQTAVLVIHKNHRLDVDDDSVISENCIYV